MNIVNFHNSYKIEHSKNKVIMQSRLFENEIGPEVLQSSVSQTCPLQEYQRYKVLVTDFCLTLSDPALSVVRQAQGGGGGAQRPRCQKLKLASTD